MKQGSHPPHVQLAILSREYVVSRSIHAIAHLGIADFMSNEPKSIEILAQETDTVPEMLDRVLNFLTLYGLFEKSETGYALTELSKPLRQDAPNSIKDILGMVDEAWWQSFAQLETCIKTGKPGFNLEHGTDLFSYLTQNTTKKAKFDKGLAKLSVFDDQAIISSAFDFGRYDSLCNVWKGNDHLADGIRQLFPHIKTTNYSFDSSAALQNAPDLFANLPDSTAYLIKGILHDFNDDQIKFILSRAHQQMSKNSRLVIAEQVIPNDNLPHTNKTMDIIMMVLVGGKQRPLLAWQELVESQGFTLKQSSPTPGLYSIMEFLRV